MPKTAVIICSFNKKEEILKCINSVMMLNYNNLELYVVDNASNDGSIEAIKALDYKHPFYLIVNKENKGGSGGFNTGILKSLEKEYKYLYLLDNDVVVDSQALISLIVEMEKDPKLGIAGSKVYIQNVPNQIQEMGAWIDWDNASIIFNQKGYIEDIPVLENFSVDYVPACSLLVRVDAVRKAGTMDEEYFLYWDDIEWAHRIKLAGYNVKAVAASKVWHKGGGVHKTSTAGTYYFWRNRLHFFNQYLPEEKHEKALGRFFEDYFQGLFSCLFYRKTQTARSMFEGVKDAINGKRGRADGHQYGEVDNGRLTFAKLIEEYPEFYIVHNDYSKTVEMTINKRYPEVKLQKWSGQVSLDGKILLIPYSHVFDSNSDNLYEGLNSYNIDVYLNLLPCDKFGKKVKERYKRKKEYFMINIVPQYIKRLRQQK
ncbi:MAG: hypothetical protein PWP07_2276 [Epulopiscium sp.]|nr:hypothetical protein [Candidatus Epulonipiscium sp.]